MLITGGGRGSGPGAGGEVFAAAGAYVAAPPAGMPRSAGGETVCAGGGGAVVGAGTCGPGEGPPPPELSWTEEWSWRAAAPWLPTRTVAPRLLILRRRKFIIRRRELFLLLRLRWRRRGAITRRFCFRITVRF